MECAARPRFLESELHFPTLGIERCVEAKTGADHPNFSDFAFFEHLAVELLRTRLEFGLWTKSPQRFLLILYYCENYPITLATVNSRIPNEPSSTPIPLCLHPPNGIRGSLFTKSFIVTVPTRSFPATRRARSRS